MTRSDGYSAGRRRKEAALEAAIRLVMTNGHLALTVRAVAEEIGVTDAALFYYFPTKDDLLVEVLRHRERHSVEAPLHLGAIHTIALAVENSQSSPELVALFADMASRARDAEHPAHAFFDQRYAALEAYIADDARQRRTDLAPPEAMALARLYLAVTDGLQRRWLVHRDIDMGALARQAASSLFDMPYDDIARPLTAPLDAVDSH